MIRTEWILCPVCRNKTRDKIRDDTVLKNYHRDVIKEPDTLDAEPMNV